MSTTLINMYDYVMSIQDNNYIINMYNIILLAFLLPFLNILLNQIYIKYNRISMISLGEMNVTTVSSLDNKDKLFHKYLENKAILYLSIIVSSFVFLSTLLLYITYDNMIGTIEYNISILNSSVINFDIGITSVSLTFILLNSFIIVLILLYNFTNYNNFISFNGLTIENEKNILHTYMYILLLVLLNSVFFSRNILLFYIFFESILPILFILVGIFGSSNRISAAYYLFIYTLFGSMFLLLGIVLLGYISKSYNYTMIENTIIPLHTQYILWILIYIGFSIKIPLFPLHIWLPLAHSESVLSGSIILASIVLKLAIYGVIEFLINLLPEAQIVMSSYLSFIAIITLIYSSFITMRQLDNKVIIAYSSIAHMAVVVIGLSSNTLIGLQGGLLLSIAHGFVSPGLFIILGGILYERYHTRLLDYYRSINIYYPVLSIFFFLFCLGNMGTPLTLNFVGELFSIIGSLNNNVIICIFTSSTLVLSAGYTIWLYNRITGGSSFNYNNNISLNNTYEINNDLNHSATLVNKSYINRLSQITLDINRCESYVLFTLLYLTIILGLLPNVMISTYNYDLSNYLY